MANKLYKEHYTVVPTKHQIMNNDKINQIKFEWLLQNKWNSLAVDFDSKTETMKTNSLEKFKVITCPDGLIEGSNGQCKCPLVGQIYDVKNNKCKCDTNKTEQTKDNTTICM
jgi:hypothetical protein